MKSGTRVKRSIEELAHAEATVWEASQYYERAEAWTWLFWSPDHPFLPLFRELDLTSVLELACGHGRHGEHLLSHFADRVRRVALMDVLPSNIEHCRTRIGARENVSFIVNNGLDFQPLEGESVTSIYCYDAMVHFHREVVRSYLKDAARVLVPHGRALLHHSNYARDPDRDFGTNPHARAFMSAALFSTYATQAGLVVRRQIVIAWGEERDLDCLSLIEKTG